MKLTYSPASPFARKVRIVAIETGLIDKLEFVPATVTPGQANDDYSRTINPLKKLPVLILDDGNVILDSFVIAEYLDELAGGKLMPQSGAARWAARTEHAILQGMLDAMLLCRYEKMLRPEALRWQTWIDDQWGRAWHGLARFEERADVLARPFDLTQIGLVCVLGYADFRFADRGWREAFPKLAAFNETMMARDSVKISAPPKA